ncbi:MAG: LPS export ABC transporter periplasmic protein LptC [Candidatus Adiutrix sp.]|nr:LPS export ABC transporter periplasmic protein LptC [Candidatus Adiutrix sp.]
MQRARFLILCAIGALALISGIMLVSVRFRATGPQILKNILPANVDMRLDNLTLSEAGDSDRSMVINAASAHYYKTQDFFELKDVRARIISSQGQYVIVAENGRYEQGRRIITLTGAVRVVDDQGGILTCPSLVFNFEEGFLRSDDRFCLNAPEYDLEGASFIFYTGDKRLDVKGRANFILQ